MHSVIQDELSWSSTKRAKEAALVPIPNRGRHLRNQEAAVATSLATQSITEFPEQIGAPAVKENTAFNASTDRRRIWLWCFLAILAAAQFDFVREMFALYLFFAISFAVLAILVAGMFMLQKVAGLAIARAAAARRPVLGMPVVSAIAAASVGHEHRKAA